MLSQQTSAHSIRTRRFEGALSGGEINCSHDVGIVPRAWKTVGCITRHGLVARRLHFLSLSAPKLADFGCPAFANYLHK